MNETVTIRKARSEDHGILSEIAFSAKKHWNYPEAYYEIWKEELTITQDYIKNNLVYVAESDNKVIGFYSIIKIENDIKVKSVLIKKGYWLEHIFILPGYHKIGIGTQLMQHAKKISKDIGIKKLSVFVEPFAVGFYKKIGASYVKDSKSSIKDRNVPVYEILIN